MADKTRLELLRAYMRASRKQDLVTVGNSLFVAHKLLRMRSLYDDFEGHGSIGVTSFKLSLDYASVKNSRTIGDIRDVGQEELSAIELIAKNLSRYTREQLQILACTAYYGKGQLGVDETKANRLQTSLRTNGISSAVE